MLKAIHKQTGELVPAWKLEEKDASWIGKEKEEWIAPFGSIETWEFLKEKGIEEVKVSFIKAHIREKEGIKYPIEPHFRITDPNKEKYNIKEHINESEEHKLAKEGIYRAIINNKLIINKKKIRDFFEIEDLFFEYHISKSEYSKIADVILIFKEKDEQYGKGIVFEIQLSPQNKEVTEERTYDRVLEGYSVCWLWHGMFDEGNELKEKEIEVVPFLKAIEEYKSKKQIEFYEEVNLYGEIIDKKLRDSKEEFEERLKQLQNKEYYLKNLIREKEEEITKSFEFKVTNDIKDKLTKYFTEKVKQDEFFKNIIKENINYNYLSDIISNKEIDNLREVFQNKIKEIIEGKINNEFFEKEILNRINGISKEIKEDYEHLKLNPQLAFECVKCGKLHPYIMSFFEKGKVYCEECFDNLDDNWRKDAKKLIKNNKPNDLKKYLKKKNG